MIYAIIAVVALLAGGGVGYAIFRYVITGKYNKMMEQAEKDANVVKQKKLLEVKEKFLNQKSCTLEGIFCYKRICTTLIAERCISLERMDL